MPATFRPGRKPSKYRAIRTEYAGVSYASKAEAAHAATLDYWLRVGAIRGWTRQVPFYLGCPENVLRVDFLVFPVRDEVYAVEIKGFRTAKCKKDFRLWARYGPCALCVITNGRTVEMIYPENREGKTSAGATREGGA